MLILIGRGLDLKELRTSETKGKIEETGLIRDERSLDVRFSGYAYGESAAALRSGQVGNDGLPDKDEIIETARIVREFTKSEASVMNRRSGSQE